MTSPLPEWEVVIRHKPTRGRMVNTIKAPNYAIAASRAWEGIVGGPKNQADYIVIEVRLIKEG